ncbi:MAG: polysaccharide deacetylase family protein [Deltaproteobacteria bacterium]|nr:polysaccharide deacetylase family protein [Deltaproteobacteria bacterium]
MRLRRRSPLLLVATLAVAGCAPPAPAPLSEDEHAELMNRAHEELARGKADGVGCSGIVPPDRGPFGKQIALTFDDGPLDVARTRKVMDVVEAHGTRATFFINGRHFPQRNGELSPTRVALLQEMLARGHQVANHTQNHANATKLSLEAFEREVKETESIVREATATRPYYFRYPGGAATCDTNRRVTALGYAVTGWHIDSADWCFGVDSTETEDYCSPNTFRHVGEAYRHDFAGWILYQLKKLGASGKPLLDGGILLMHDSQAFTVRKLDSVLTRLEQEGFRFVMLSDRRVFPKLNAALPSSLWHDGGVADAAPRDATPRDAGPREAGTLSDGTSTDRLHPVGPFSTRCAGCDLATHDCRAYKGTYTCTARSASCSYTDGYLFKQCDCTGWAFCLPGNVWGRCGQAPAGIFSCR